MPTFPNEFPKQSLGDIIDKITILTRKIYYGEEEAIQEFNYLTDALTRSGIDGSFLAASIRLAQINFEIWNRENDLRQGREGNFSDEEIACRCIEIRDLNRKRVRYKNEINRMSDMGFREFKVKHRSM